MADKIRVILEVDAQKGVLSLKEFDQAMNQAAKGLEGSGRSAQQAEKAVAGLDLTWRKLGAAITGVGFAAGAVAAVQKAIQAYSAFENQLKSVSTMLNVQSMGLDTYNYQMKSYAAGLRGLSLEMGESTETLSKGLYDILSASVAPAKALDVLEESTKAARAGMTNTAVAADLITTALNAYGLAADDAGRVSDIAFATVAQGKLTFEELAQNIGKVAPAASQAGASFEQLGAMIATMTRQGVRAEIATTALNSLFVSFARQSDEQKKAWEKVTRGTELAGTAFSSALLRGDNLFQTLGVLSGANEKLRLSIAGETSALLALNNILKDTDGLKKDLERTTRAQGEAQEAFNKVINSSKVAQEKAKKATEDFWRTLGEMINNESVEELNNFTKGMQGLTTTLREFAGLDINTIDIFKGLNLKESQSTLTFIQEELDGLEGRLEGLKGRQSSFTIFDRLTPKAYSVAKEISQIEARILELYGHQASILQRIKGLKSEAAKEPIINTHDEDVELARLATSFAETDEKILKARQKLQKDLELVGIKGYEREKIILDRELKENLEFSENAALAYQIYNAKREELDNKYYDKALDDEAKFYEEQTRRELKQLKESTRINSDRLEARREFELEIARLSGDTRRVQELELNKYVESYKKAGLSTEEIERLKNLKIQEMNKSTLDKWIDAWSDTGARMQDIMKTTFENLTNAAGNFFGDLLFDIRSLDDGLRSLEKTAKDIIKNIFGSASTAYLQGGIAGLFKGQGFSGFSLDTIVKAFSGSQGGGSGAGGFTAIPAAGGTGAGIWSAATGGGTAYGTAYVGAQQAAQQGAMGFTAQGTAGTQAGIESGLMAGGLAGPAAMMMYAAAPIVIGNTLGPYINKLFGMTGTYSAEDAQARIAQDFEVMTSGIAALTDAAQKMGDMFGGYLTPGIMDTATELKALADVAGYGQAGMEAMTDALGGQAAAVVEAGAVAQGLNYQLADLVWNFKLANEGGSALGGGVNELTTLMDDLIYSLDLGADQTQELKFSTHDLVEELYLGNMTVEQITGALQDDFNAALEKTIASGEVTADTFRKVAESIKSVPTSWSTTYSVRGPSTSTYTDALPTYDRGHIPVLDSGTMPGHYLAWLQFGEAAIRPASVNQQTAPVLDHINRTGQVPATGGDTHYHINMTINADILDDPMGADRVLRKIRTGLNRLDSMIYRGR